MAKIKHRIAIIVLLFFSLDGFSQSRIITGIVTDSSYNPISGVSVTISCSTWKRGWLVWNRFAWKRDNNFTPLSYSETGWLTPGDIRDMTGVKTKSGATLYILAKNSDAIQVMRNK